MILPSPLFRAPHSTRLILQIKSTSHAPRGLSLCILPHVRVALSAFLVGVVLERNGEPFLPSDH